MRFTLITSSAVSTVGTLKLTTLLIRWLAFRCHGGRDFECSSLGFYFCSRSPVL